VDGYRIGRLHRLLRQHAALTQAALAARARVGRWKIVQLEAGEIGKLRFDEGDRCFGALGARLDVRAWYHGAAADRLFDERHASLAGEVVRELRRLGWQIELEVSFSDYGDRGSIDVLGWHAGYRVLVVIEVKSELGAIEGTLRPLDVKCRVAPTLVARRYGWRPLIVGRLLVLPAERSARRAVKRHGAVFSAALPARTREVRRWLNEPASAMAGLWFVTDVGSINGKRNPSAIRRVRARVSRSGPGRSAT